MPYSLRTGTDYLEVTILESPLNKEELENLLEKIAAEKKAHLKIKLTRTRPDDGENEAHLKQIIKATAPQSISLSFFAVSDSLKPWEALGRIVAESPVRNWQLSNMNLKGERLKTVAPHLIGLESLDINSNNLGGSETAEILVRILENNPELHRLNLSNNNLTDGDLKIIGPALARLEEFNLSLNYVTEATLKKLKQNSRTARTANGAGLHPLGATAATQRTEQTSLV